MDNHGNAARAKFSLAVFSKQTRGVGVIREQTEVRCSARLYEALRGSAPGRCHREPWGLWGCGPGGQGGMERAQGAPPLNFMVAVRAASRASRPPGVEWLYGQEGN